MFFKKTGGIINKFMNIFQNVANKNSAQLKLNKVNSSIYIIVGLIIFSILLNFGFVKADQDLAIDYNLMQFADSNLPTVINNISSYTSTIDENIDEFNNTIALEQSGEYLNKNSSVITEASKLEIDYIAQKGDTISTIAKKFDLHVATILGKNNIAVDQIEKIHIGQHIIIPPKDTSDSQDWLVQLNAKKEQDRQLALKAAQKKAQLASAKRSTVTRERSSAGYSGQASSGWAEPISYRYISRRLQRGHYGIDMVVNVGTSVYASKSGKVIEITRNYGSGFGNSILIDHGNGETSRYAHLSAFNIGVGDNVDQGQLIGQSGNTGWSTGPHLHFEVRINGRAYDPGL
jgi:murein DD-endopeptidase MepM/ murein hydrolase activator NlpD